MAAKKATIKIPKHFYNDHVSRGLPAPDIVREAQRHYIIEAMSPHLDGMLERAEYYEAISEHIHYLFGLVSSASATAAAIRAAHSGEGTCNRLNPATPTSGTSSESRVPMAKHARPSAER